MGVDSVTIDRVSIAAEDISHLGPYVTPWKDSSIFWDPSGRQHYKLLANIARQFPEGSVFTDLGTHLGYSALALSTVPSNKVITYDICDCIGAASPSPKTKPNIVFNVKNCLDDMDTVAESQLIYLDVDPHDGIQEVAIFEELEKRGYKGVVILDDIHFNSAMEQFWQGITQSKWDISHVGHYSGTGIVSFAPPAGPTIGPTVVII
jgi:hypothetical protein